jgi:hypothetical protein
MSVKGKERVGRNQRNKEKCVFREEKARKKKRARKKQVARLKIAHEEQKT